MFGYDDAIGAGISAIGGIESAQQNDFATKARQAALANLQNIGTPQLNVQFNPYTSAGKIDPSLESAVNQGNSQMAGISTSPSQAGLDAISNLQNVSRNGGLTIADKANLNNIQNQSNAQMSGARGAIQQNMNARGLGGSGLELAAQLSNAQNAVNNANTQGTAVAGQAQQNALNAVSNAGTLGQNMQGQQYQQQAAKAQAQDVINKFNTQNNQNVANTNVANKNTAQYANLNNAQNISNQNTGLQNQQSLQNNAYQQQAFQDTLSKQQAAAGQSNTVAGQATANGQAAGKFWGGIGQGVIQAGASNNSSATPSQDKWNSFLNSQQQTNTNTPVEEKDPIGGAVGAYAGSNGY
jgi:hypothetical protein